MPRRTRRHSHPRSTVPFVRPPTARPVRSDIRSRSRDAADLHDARAEHRALMGTDGSALPRAIVARPQVHTAADWSATIETLGRLTRVPSSVLDEWGRGANLHVTQVWGAMRPDREIDGADGWQATPESWRHRTFPVLGALQWLQQRLQRSARPHEEIYAWHLRRLFELHCRGARQLPLSSLLGLFQDVRHHRLSGRECQDSLELAARLWQWRAAPLARVDLFEILRNCHMTRRSHRWRQGALAELACVGTLAAQDYHLRSVPRDPLCLRRTCDLVVDDMRYLEVKFLERPDADTARDLLELALDQIAATANAEGRYGPGTVAFFVTPEHFRRVQERDRDLRAIRRECRGAVPRGSGRPHVHVWLHSLPERQGAALQPRDFEQAPRPLDLLTTY